MLFQMLINKPWRERDTGLPTSSYFFVEKAKNSCKYLLIFILNYSQKMLTKNNKNFAKKLISNSYWYCRCKQIKVHTSFLNTWNNNCPIPQTNKKINIHQLINENRVVLSEFL